MFNEALITIAKRWQRRKCPSTDEWMNQMWYIYTVEFYWAKKRYSDSCYSMGESSKYYARWKKLDTKGQIFQYLE